MSEQKMTFQAEVGRLLEIVTHSLYSDREIFLRELISNASDACDKLRYLSLTQADLLTDAEEFKIKIEILKDKSAIKISDNGIGMNRQDVIDNIGTIAKSGTASFLNNLEKAAQKDVSMIGQFGVGFYASFIVADRVEVITKKAGEKEAWLWTSEGKEDFTLAEVEKETHGTEIILHLKKDAAEFAEKIRLEHIVKKYSDHIALPVVFVEDKKEEAVNNANALWTRSKSEISKEQYQDFYKHITHHFDDPLVTMHWRAEGMIEYSALLFIPTEKPFDLLQQDRKNKIKLYVNRVFISDDIQDILPGYLRFIQGIVDSSDLPLNVSREMLQNNPLLLKIRAGLLKKIFAEIEKLSKTDDYLKFWTNFGATLKEGLYEDIENRERLLPFTRFYSSEKNELISLDDYLSAVSKEQKVIYYLTGEDQEALLRSPHLEGFKNKNIDVLIMTDPVDEFWIPQIGKYKDVEFKSITRAGNDLDAAKGDKKDKKKDEKKTSSIDKLIAAFKVELKDKIKDIKATTRLVDSLAILTSDEGDMDIHMERLLKQNQKIDGLSKRILEINANHPAIQKLNDMVDQKEKAQIIADTAWLLLDQARITEGEAVIDAQSFQKRIAQLLINSL